MCICEFFLSTLLISMMFWMVSFFINLCRLFSASMILWVLSSLLSKMVSYWLYMYVSWEFTYS